LQTHGAVARGDRRSLGQLAVGPVTQDTSTLGSAPRRSGKIDSMV
jgi:hypothetical protein